MILEILLSVIPVIGPALSTTVKVAKNFDRWAPALVDSTKSLVDGGFKAVGSTTGSNPVTQQIGTVIDLGLLMKTVMSSMKGDLETWAKTLFAGTADASGKTIIDYFVGGRFTLSINVSEKYVNDAYFKTQIAKVVNTQWQDKTKGSTRTFVMCTNSSSAATTCRDPASAVTEGSRTCCLTSVDKHGNIVTPPALEKLAGVAYNISGADAAAGSLHSYLAGGLIYDEAKVRQRLRAAISMNASDSFLAQGVRFQGVWTLPVCDGGSSNGPLPCCCGAGCGETGDVWAAVGIPKTAGGWQEDLNSVLDGWKPANGPPDTGSVLKKCKTQCPTCPSANGVGG